MEVRVRGEGLKVYSRRGYLAREDKSSLAPPTKQEQLLAAIRSPLARRDLDPAAGVTGVASVVPLYASWQSLFWKEPGGDKSYLVQAFAFDPDRKAILLVAGDKSGGSEKKFYRQLIDKADGRFDAHLAAIKKRKQKKRK